MVHRCMACPARGARGPRAPEGAEAGAGRAAGRPHPAAPCLHFSERDPLKGPRRFLRARSGSGQRPRRRSPTEGLLRSSPTGADGEKRALT